MSKSEPESVDWSALKSAAIEAMKRAYAPYSDFPVGAAALVDDGRIVSGCNVENASYGLALCAERNAVGQMIAAGQRDPIAVVVVTAGPVAGSPCGMCRQTLAEFGLDDLLIRLVVAGHPESAREVRLGQLLPEAFRADVLPATTAKG